jgi:hypothetical protein
LIDAFTPDTSMDNECRYSPRSVAASTTAVGVRFTFGVRLARRE